MYVKEDIREKQDFYTGLPRVNSICFEESGEVERWVR